MSTRSLTCFAQLVEILESPAIIEFYDFYVDAQLSQSYINFYFICLLYSLLVTTYTIHLSLKIKAYHHNLKQLFRMSFGQWFLIGSSKMLTLLYYEDCRQDCYNFRAAKLIEYSAFLRYLFMFSACATPFWVMLERCLATYWITSYEKHRRSWISSIILILNVGLGSWFAISITKYQFSLLYMIFVVVTLIMSCCSLIIFLYKFNIRKIYQLDNFHRKTTYSLSKRFQLRENVRIISLVAKLILASMGLITIVCTGIILPLLFKSSNNYIRTIRIVIDLGFHCHSTLLFGFSLVFIPEFRTIFNGEVRKILCISNRSSVDATPSNNLEKNRQNEADVYFDLFHKSMGRPKI